MSDSALIEKLYYGEEIDSFIRFHSMDDSYNSWEALCFWFELDPNDEQADFLDYALNIEYAFQIDDGQIEIETPEGYRSIKNPFLESYSLCAVLMDAHVTIDNVDRMALLRYNAFIAKAKNVYYFIKKKRTQEATISRDDLLFVARALQEKPRFLFMNEADGSKKAIAPKASLPKNIDSSVTERLEIIMHAASHFWEGVSEESWETASARKGKDKENVQEWLRDKGLNKTQAMYVDLLIRPKFTGKGGNVKMKG